MKFNIILTNKCNMSCTYCYEENKSDESISKSDVKKINKFIVEAMDSQMKNNLKLIFHGGEPTLNFEAMKQIVEEFRQLQKMECRYEITTNAYKISDSMLAFFQENSLSVSVSIDGIKESHDKNRLDTLGRGTYDSVIRNAKKIIDSGLEVRCRMTITKDCIAGMYDGIVELSKVGFKTFAVVLDLYEDNWTENNYSEISEVVERLESRFKYSDTKISILDDCNVFSTKSDCLGGISTLTIDSNLDIYPCIFALKEKELIIGKVGETNISDVKKKAEELLKDRYAQKSFCEGCGAELFCEGKRCRILSYVVNDSYDVPVKSLCMMTRILTERRMVR